jgi:hypothetical protein
MEGGEAETLIAALADHIVKPAFVYRKWRLASVLGISSTKRENTSSSLVGISETAISTCRRFPPLRGTCLR